MLRDSVSAIGVLTAPWYLTAVSKDLVRRPTRFHMILVSPPYRTNWGGLLADSGTIRRKLLDQLRDALVFRITFDA